MSLFIREEHTSDIDKIWNYITSKGTALFRYGSTEKLWRLYSDECWAAGFIDINEETLESFIDWLEECDLEII